MRYLITDLIAGHTVTIDTLELTAEEAVEAILYGLVFLDDDHDTADTLANTLVRDLVADLLAGRPHSEHAAAIALAVTVTQITD